MLDSLIKSAHIINFELFYLLGKLNLLKKEASLLTSN